MTASREDALLLARAAGLDLPEYHDDLLVAWDKLQSMLSRMPRGERDDEPAQVFPPERFMPQG